MKKFINRIKFRYKHPVIFYTFLSLFLMSIISLFLILNYINNVLKDTPTITTEMLKSEQTSNIFDKDGKVIWSETKIRRDYINKKDIPQLYKDLLISTEDKDFYKNPGFSYKGLANAGISMVKEKLGTGVSRGGSTIEQQLIKNIAFSSSLKDRTIDRKIKELWLAQQLYENHSKDQILEWYINKIEMGENSYGANTAAITYYGKSLNEMNDYSPENISKLATIAGLGQAPSSYNIYNHPKAAENRRNVVLYSTYKNNKISKAQYEAAKKIKVTNDLKPRYWRNNLVLKETKRHSAYVNSVLKQISDLGYDISKTPIQVYTELDSKKNDELNKIINSYTGYKDKNQQIAATLIDPKTGIVIAQSGGRNVTDPFSINRATNNNRSSGSSIKPFIDYGPAIEYLGYGTNYKLDSSPYTYPGTNFTANNFGGYTYGIVDMKFALRMSLNTPAIRLLDEHVGSDKAKQFLSNLDLSTKDSYGGGDALGLNLSTADLANAYATLANKGIYNKAKYINKIKFADGSIKTIKFTPKKAMKESTAYILLKILEGTMQDNFSAPKAKINEFKGHSAKSGTVAYDQTDTSVWRPDTAASDAWLAGTTKSISLAIWTGYDSPNKPGNWVLEEQNARSDIYKQIMKHFNKGKDTSEWVKPKSVYQEGIGMNADFSPIDINYKEFEMPIIENSNYNNIYENLSKNNLNDIKDSNQKTKIAPKNYKIEDWKKDLKNKDKEILNKWEMNESIPDKSNLPNNVWTTTLEE